MKPILALVIVLVTASRTAAFSQENASLSRAALNKLARSCAPRVAPDTIEAITRSESAFRPYALSINYPQRSARNLGYRDSNLFLTKQPKDKDEAIRWTRWFLNHGYTVSIGLMQINIEVAKSLHVRPRDLFDPCVNLTTGARILQADYAMQTQDLDGLVRSFSMYNSGSPSTGVQNGYTASVIKNAPKP
jgi:type IV secretion system protein VirB1